MSAIVDLFPHGSTRLLGKQGYELAPEAGAMDGATFAHAIIEHLHTQPPVGASSNLS